MGDRASRSTIAQNLVCASGIWQSRKERIQEDNPSHLDELSERLDWIEARQLSKTLVHIIDREADSVGHLRQWGKQGHMWLIRVKESSKARSENGEMALSRIAENLPFHATRSVACKGQTCTQWVASTNVVLTRPAKPKRFDAHGVRVSRIPGEPLATRLAVSKITNVDGDLVAQWYLLTNAPDHIDEAQLALWYYFLWEVETFFKLLKSAGHQLESWEQETARATFNRILIATQACVMAWALMAASDEAAIKARLFLVRLPGRQMKRTRPATIPAILDGMFILFTMFEALEQYSISELREFAHIAKNQLNL